MLASLLNGIIRTALHNRMLVAALATFVLLFGAWQINQLPIDVFPDLNRPRVVVMTEARGMAPEEVETLVAFPLETALNGASGVQAVRSSSGPGVSVIYVEFDWGTDIFRARQIVAERLAVASEGLPEGVRPQLAPISSIMGQIMVVGLYSSPGDDTLSFRLRARLEEQLNAGHLPDLLRGSFAGQGIYLSNSCAIKVQQRSEAWTLTDAEQELHYTILATDGELQIHRTTSPMQLRTIADWVVRQEFLTTPGVAQVFVMGGERRQYQVLVNPHQLTALGVTLEDVETALRRSNQNVTGGYLDQQGPNEFLVRALGRVKSIEDIQQVVVARRGDRSILLRHVARVITAAQVKRGDGSAFVRNEDGIAGGPAAILTINKQPGADTREVTERIEAIIAGLEQRLPDDVQIAGDLYQQKLFIDLAIANVVEALRDGGLFVVIILFLFLLNFRTTFVTLTAIPLSIVITALVFKAFGLSINTMTHGGLAVAIGELVDDAIVDVENIFRRLKENRARAEPQPALLVVFRASVEIRNSIVFGTMVVVLVFIPLFALGGIEGRLFTPLGIAYIVSLLSSLFISLTVTPVLSYWLLSNARTVRHNRDGHLLRGLKWVFGLVIHGSLRVAPLILIAATLAVIIAGRTAGQMENDFLPPFNEGAVQVNVFLPPGASLESSNRLARLAQQRLLEIDEVQRVVRRTGRAELDEHAEGVNVSEFIASLNPNTERSRETVLADIRERLKEIPGIVVSVEQPLSHLISHMLSGVKAQVAIKLYGDDLDVLRRTAEEMKAAIADIEGVRDLLVEPQIIVPQLRIEVDGLQLERYGLTRADVTEYVETAMNGVVVSEVLEGQRKFDLLVRLDESYREDLETLDRLTIPLPNGGSTRLGAVTRIYRGGGPNSIVREQVRRRIVLQCNVAGRGLVDVVKDIKQRLAPIERNLDDSYFVEYGGQFESQQSASRMISILFVVSLVGMFLVLYTMFRSVNLALQVMVALPMAFIGSVVALVVTEQTLTVAAMVGFISLCGIASRNGILLINHYLHLVKFEGESWTREMIVRAGKDRLAPVLMTALTTGIGLVPLALAFGEPGKEILYPVATVIIGGLISSTLLEFLVRPALFWKFGVSAARRVTEQAANEVVLFEETQQS